MTRWGRKAEPDLWVVSPDRIEHADITRILEKGKPAEPFFIDGRVDQATTCFSDDGMRPDDGQGRTVWMFDQESILRLAAVAGSIGRCIRMALGMFCIGEPH